VKASGSKLHDGKTVIMKMGKMREMTKKQLGVEFTIMEKGGDVIGNEVEEETTFGEIIEKVEELGAKWNKEQIGIYGRSIVANTLLLAKLKHRANVNAISKRVKKKIMDAFKAFVWKGKEKRARVRWEVMIKGVDEGGIGVKDPIIALDSAKVSMLVRLMTRDRQPWMKWIERKLMRVAKRWGVEEAMAAKTKKKQRDGLKETCLVECTLKIWLEIGGTKREPREVEVERKGKKEMRRETGFGVEVGKEWIAIERLKSKHIYAILTEKRTKLKDYQPNKAHKHVNEIQKQLSADERDYWWRRTHKLISIKKTESKWKRDKHGVLVDSKCPVCKLEEEDREHYEYGCKVMEGLRERVARKAGRESSQISKEEWMLETEVEVGLRVLIAKARWIYHCERCKIDIGKRRRMNIEIVMQRLDRRMKIIAEADKQQKKPEPE
jgi:hypothetical protein